MMDIPTDWTFRNSNVASNFDRHVREQLPWYDLATGAVAHIARHYIPDGGLVYDIGASTGNVGKALAEIIEKRKARVVAIDNSEEMAAMYTGPGEIVVADAMTHPFEHFDVAIAFLVLMFMPPGQRRDWIVAMSQKIKPGGAMIILDKFAMPYGYLSTVLHRLTIAGKVAAGANSDDIIRKELSLGGVQRPLPHRFLDCIAPGAAEVFRFGEFACWVIERPE